jgi:hypothetical protein
MLPCYGNGIIMKQLFNKNKNFSYQETDLSIEFEKCASEVVKILSYEGITRKVSFGQGVLIYKALPTEEKKSVLNLVKFYLETLVFEQEKLLERPNNDSSLWKSMRLLDIRLPSDFFAYLTNDDCIEIYDLNNIQRWRNKNLMKKMSHTIEQMFCVPWTSRYNRDEAAMTKCIEGLKVVLNQKKPAVHQINVKNILQEIGSEDQLSLDVIHKFIAPTHNSYGELNGYAAVSSVEIIGSNKRMVKDH